MNFYIEKLQESSLMKKTLLLIGLALVIFLSGCSDKTPEDALVSQKVKTGPEMDGMLDDSWQLAKSLEIMVEVPEYEHFDEIYFGKKYIMPLIKMPASHTLKTTIISDRAILIKRFKLY